jgi:glycosyltransferase involved in cell wall biosynthesis
MHLLFVLPSFPFPPADGGSAKVINILRYLSVRHKCDLICYGDIDRADVAGLRQHIPLIGKVWIVAPPSSVARIFRSLTNLIFLRPPSFARYSSSEMFKRIDAIKQIGNYDVIHFDIINMAPYHQNCRELPSIHSPNDATSLTYRRLSESVRSVSLRLWLRAISLLLARYERKHYGDFSLIHVVSEIDRDYLVSLVPKARVSVVPITSGYTCKLSEIYPIKQRSGTPIVTVCGNLGDASIAEGFHEFIRLVLPVVSCAYPDLRVRVLGRRISASLKRELRKHSQVEFFAWVDSFEEFLSASDVVLLPDRAGAPGVKTRTVQAMALGQAVLGSQTAFEGIQIVNLRHGAVYSTHEECRDLLLLLLGNYEMRKELGVAAARLVADEYSLERIGPQYEAMYLQALRCHV